jgi:hypothetical protein
LSWAAKPRAIRILSNKNLNHARRRRQGRDFWTLAAQALPRNSWRGADGVVAQAVRLAVIIESCNDQWAARFFDAGQKCLLGIISRKITVRPNSGAPESEQKDIAKYFVPAGPSYYRIASRGDVARSEASGAHHDGYRPDSFCRFTHSPYQLSNGRGSATRPARLTVRGASLPRPTGQVERGRGGYLLDSRADTIGRPRRPLACAIGHTNADATSYQRLTPSFAAGPSHR